MTDFILALSVVFVSAGLLLIVANHFGVPTVPFYIAAGLVSGLLIDDTGLLVELALWGIAFLVFVFGIRVDIGDLQSVLRDGEGAAAIQLVVVAPIAMVVGYGLSLAFGFEDPIRNGIYFAAAATLSSTLVGASALQEEIRRNLIHGRLASAIHFFDDIVAIGVLLVLSAEVLTDAQLVTSQIGYGVLFLVAGLLIYRHGFPLLVRAADGGDELVLMGSISILIAFLAAAELVGISIVVGAFAAGIAIRNEGARSLGVRNGIESIADFFTAIFFVTIGALVSVPTVEVLVFTAALVSLVLLVNPLLHTIAFMYEGYDSRTAFFASSSLGQVSEFALVIAIQAQLVTETIAPGLFDAIILAAVVTMVASAVGNRYENAIYSTVLKPLLDDRSGYIDEYSDVDPDLDDHVVVIGYGQEGRQLVQTLETIEVPYVVVENDPVKRTALRADCRNYVFGDAMAEYPMERARVGTAALVVSTIDYRPLSKSLLKRDFGVELILRSDTAQEAQELLDAGATFVAVPDVLAADAFVETVERVLEDKTVTESLQTEHREYLRELRRNASTGD